MEEKIKTKKQRGGVTLVALVITVIVLLILAGITISLIIGEDGIIKRAQQAGKNYLNAAEYEKLQIAEFTNEMNNILSTTTANGRTLCNSIELVLRAYGQQAGGVPGHGVIILPMENINSIQFKTLEVNNSQLEISYGNSIEENGIMEGTIFYTNNQIVSDYIDVELPQVDAKYIQFMVSSMFGSGAIQIKIN